MKQKMTAIVINEKDNVATALEDLHEGREIRVIVCGKDECVRLLTDIPSGHKFALFEIEQGSNVIKYGEPIGHSTVHIKRGQHVHTHNVTSPKNRSAR
ncbi:MAG TPA: UxaA family hydrolase [Syntrophorhabdaceae bacterium]|nr:UxaA family hydrolase [Syntrophorhabdaceae bacterium]